MCGLNECDIEIEIEIRKKTNGYLRMCS